jgi:hypothetical protein
MRHKIYNFWSDLAVNWWVISPVVGENKNSNRFKESDNPDAPI